MIHSYDLSPLYRHSTSHLIPSSPATIVSVHASKLILRSSSTLQIIRTWSLVQAQPPSPTSSAPAFTLSISPRDPHYILAHHHKLQTAWVLDPASDDPVAKLQVGKVEGCSGMAWDQTAAEGHTVLVWAENHLRVSLFRLSSEPTTKTLQIQSPKLNYSLDGGHSFSERYFALLERHQNRDCLAIYDPRSNWALLRNIVIPDPTSDLVGLKWAPRGGHYLATWSSITHYYLHIFTPDGRLIKTFEPYSTSASTATGEEQRRTGDASGWVGLGIRVVEWSPDGEFLAIGGYDGKIRILSRAASWNVVSELACPSKITANSTTIWKEPGAGWVEKTLGRGIISFDRVEASSRSAYVLANDIVPPDTTKPFPKMGWSKLRWSDDGRWLVGHNQSYPNHLFVFSFLTSSPSPSSSSSPDSSSPALHIRPRLHSLILLNSPPKAFEFKPSTHSSSLPEADTLVILSGSKSFTVWASPIPLPPAASPSSMSDQGTVESENVGTAEGVGIPSPSTTTFNPNLVEFSQGSNRRDEEQVILVGEKGGMFCLVYPRTLATPLSKRFQPFLQRILLRTVSLSKWETIKLFNRSIRNDPTLAELVKSFHVLSNSGFDRWKDPTSSKVVISERRQDLACLLAQLSSAVDIGFVDIGFPFGIYSFGTKYFSTIFWTELVANPQRFERLRSLQIDILDPDTELESIRGILPLQHLPNLTELVACWFKSPSVVEPPSQIALPSIASLTFGGSHEFFADASMAELVTSCPNLKHLAIKPTFKPGAAVAILSAIPSTLVTLHLPSHTKGEVFRLLPRLSSLESLDVGKIMDAEELLQYLAELCNLSSLTLGCRRASVFDNGPTEAEKAIVAELVDGPLKLPALSRLYLRFVSNSSIDEASLEWVLAKAKSRGIRLFKLKPTRL
ncbi:hypothetical protein JCM11491_002641 [Sporobolomyces phaffii]